MLLGAEQPPEGDPFLAGRVVRGIGDRPEGLEAEARPDILRRCGQSVVLVVAATGGERNETLFGGFFVEAFTDGEGDLDKDGRLSILEAFTWARRRVDEAYSKENLLVTEHAALDDNGDGKGSLEPDPVAGDGALARTMVLAGRVADPVATSVCFRPFWRGIMAGLGNYLQY